MKNQMDALILKDYQRRWQAVAAAEAGEQQATPLAVRWQQLNSIIRLAAALGLSVEANSRDVDALIILSAEEIPHLLQRAKEEG